MADLKESGGFGGSVDGDDTRPLAPPVSGGVGIEDLFDDDLRDMMRAYESELMRLECLGVKLLFRLLAEQKRKHAGMRIQRRRARGWRMPPHSKYVGRPSRWGNPFEGEDAVSRFRFYLQLAVRVANGKRLPPGDCPDPKILYYGNDPIAVEVWGRFVWMAHNLAMITGRQLACWCELDERCHGDVLVELAND